MTPTLRKLNLTAHVTCSVGWLGGVASFLVLSIVGRTSQNAELVRGAYLAMNLLGQFIIVPLSLAALLTGLVQSLGTQWGLFRHYWIVLKLFLAALTVVVLLLQMGTIAQLAEIAALRPFTDEDLGPQMRVVLHAAGGLAVLIAATILSIYKPRGMTRYGASRQLG